MTPPTGRFPVRFGWAEPQPQPLAGGMAIKGKCLNQDSIF
jgi:hypothetical protein